MMTSLHHPLCNHHGGGQVDEHPNVSTCLYVVTASADDGYNRASDLRRAQLVVFADSTLIIRVTFAAVTPDIEHPSLATFTNRLQVYAARPCNLVQMIAAISLSAKNTDRTAAWLPN